MTRFGVFPGACLIAGVVAVCCPRAGAATTLGQPMVQQQRWTGFADAVDPDWNYKTTVVKKARRKRWKSIQSIIQAPGWIGNPSKYGLKITTTVGDSDVFDRGLFITSLRDFRKTPELEAPGVVADMSDHSLTDAFSKAVLWRGRPTTRLVRGLPVSNQFSIFNLSFGQDDELPLVSQVLNRRGKLINMTTSYASLTRDMAEDGFHAVGRVSTGDIWLKNQRKKTANIGTSVASFSATYQFSRAVNFDLTAALARFRWVNAHITIVNADTGEQIIGLDRPRTGKKKSLTLGGTLDAGTYKITAFADSTLRRHRRKMVARGGEAEFDVNFQFTPVVSDAEILEPARRGEMPVGELLDVFEIDGDELIYLVSEGELPASYLNEHTGLSDLELVTKALSGPESYIPHVPDGPFYDAPLMRRVLDELPDFAVYTAKGKLIYDSIEGYVGPYSPYRDEMRKYVDDFGWYEADYVHYEPDFVIELLGPGPSGVASVPEPTTAALLSLGSAILLRRRGR